MDRNDYLQHYGVKGMKWGVRRFQDKNGRLTNAGKKRYSDDKKTTKGPSKNELKYQKYYAQYKTLGYDDVDAEQTAKGRIKTEQALKIAGGIALTAAVGYAAYRYYDDNVDRYISSGKTLQTVHTGDVKSRITPGNPFFATYKKMDNDIYSSRKFSHFGEDSSITKMYTKDGIKIASEKTGRKVFEDLLKTNPELQEYAARASDVWKVPSGKSKKSYQAFNWSLVLRNDTEERMQGRMNGLDHDKVHKLFYDELRKRGYGAVVDINDSKLEGWTHTPLIVFDNQIKHVISTTKATAEDLGAEKLRKGRAYSDLRKMALNPLTNTYVAAGAASLAYNGITVATDRQSVNRQLKYVETYRKEHPNSKLSSVQILELQYA